jgi:putative tricarboxylic transport membrane protein
VSVLRVPKPVLLPSILALAIAGTVSLENHLFEVWLALGFAMLGHLMG